jgi:mannose-6-phosphate isomerase-like protein (cupin superfamily)
MNFRCVVTGHTGSGKTVVLSEAPPPAITLDNLPGYEFHRLWGGESVPTIPAHGNTAGVSYFPPKGGFRFGFFVIPPGTHVAPPLTDLLALAEELQRKLPGMAEVLEPDHPGMHTTDTVDYDVIVSGEAYLELDDGAEVLLKAGDCVIQNGTRHAWHNRSTEKCVIAVTLIGADRTR